MMIPGMNGMPMPNNMLESEMIGAIKIKDGLFIGDEYASTVSANANLTLELYCVHFLSVDYSMGL